MMSSSSVRMLASSLVRENLGKADFNLDPSISDNMDQLVLMLEQMGCEVTMGGTTEPITVHLLSVDVG